MGTPTRSNVYDATKNWKEVLYIGGRQSEDFGYTLAEDIQDHERQNLGNQIFNVTVPLSGFNTPTLNNTTGVVTMPNGVVYVGGRAENVAGTQLNMGTTQTFQTIFLEWVLNQITAVQDNTLVDPNTLSPIYEMKQTQVSLVSSTPDAFDEPFETWNQLGLPLNSFLNLPWTLNSGAISQATPAAYGNYAMMLEYTAGTATTATSPVFPITPGTIYTVYFWVKTVYGQTDLPNTAGAYVQVNLGSPVTQVFSTTGGSTLQGGYTQYSFTFSSGAASSTSLTVNIPGTVLTNTQVLIDSILVTSQALASSLQLDRHFYPLFNWDRINNPSELVPVVTPKCALNLQDLGGTLPATRVTGIKESMVGLDENAAPDITGPDGMSALIQLATLRALLNGSATQPFNVAAATSSTQAPEASQIQQAAFITGLDTGTLNNTVITLVPTPTAYTFGMRVQFQSSYTNTGPCTININNLGVKNILRPDFSQLQPNDIIKFEFINVVYDGVQFQLDLYSPDVVYQNGTPLYAVDTSTTAGQYVVTLPVTPGGYVPGMTARFKANTTNPGNGTETVNLNGLGAFPLTFNGTRQLAQYDIMQGQIVEVVFDGATFQMVSNSSSMVTDNSGVGNKRLKNSFNGNGFCLFPSGFLINWFATTSIGAGATITVTLPQPCTQAVFFGMATSGAGPGIVIPIAGNITQVQVENAATSNSGVFSCIVFGV